MRLIDADELKNEIGNFKADIHDNEYDAEKFDFIFEWLYETLEEQPTAYDVDELIKQGIDNCYLSHRYEHPGYEEGMCAGLRTMNGLGEPIDCCKECKLNYLYKSEYE